MADVRISFETNFFGTLRVIEAALPFLRQQGSEHVLGVSSGMGIVAVPLIGFYCASIWAVEAAADGSYVVGGEALHSSLGKKRYSQIR